MTQKTAAGALRSGDKTTASEAARALGQLTSPAKAAASRRNGTLKKIHAGPAAKNLLDLKCDCGAGDETTVGENHKTTCPRGRLIYQRARKAAREEK